MLADCLFANEPRLRSSPECSDGEELCKAGDIKNWTKIIEDSCVFLGVIFTSFIVILRQKNYNPPILIQLGLLVIAYIGYEIRNFQKTITHDIEFNNTGMPAWLWYPYCTAQILFLV